MYDLLVLNGKIVSGMGNPWYSGDLAVVKDKIVKIGRLEREQARKVIDAKGLVISPGFIDGHTHSDLSLFVDPMSEAKISQGVTTENVGMDGMSLAPIEEKDIPEWRKYLSGLTGNPKVEWRWRTFSDYLDAVDASPPSVNITSYVGLGTIRLKVMGMADREATPHEIGQMKRIAAQSMEEGARGISAGLIYPPGQYQTLNEIVEIAKIVRGYDGIFNVHMRSEGRRIFQAMEEVIEVGRRSAIPVLITHFKVTGKKNWGLSEKALQVVDDARREGVEVSIEQYPYTAGSTMLQAVVPPWYASKGPDQLIQMLRESRESIKKDIHERMDWENMVANIGWEKIIVSSTESTANKGCEGKSIAEIAQMRSLDDPADAALDLLIEERLSVGMITFSMSEEDVIRIMKHPAVNFITDSLPGGGKSHPRACGTFPRILGRYSRDQGVLTIEEAVRKMTSLPAEKLRLKGKGVIAEGYDSDIVIFNADKIVDNATFANPNQPASGVAWVIVNGQVVVENGEHTNAKPGRTVRTR